MTLDIVIFAVIAVVLLARLWTVFGRRSDDDPQRPNPFVMPAPGAQDDKKSAPVSVPPDATELPRLLQPLHAPPASLEGGLEQIKALIPAFDEKAFLKDARGLFTTIVEDFSKGDLSRSEKLLGLNVLPNFQAAIAARQKTGQSMETRIVRFRDVETVAAHVEESRALLTVRFVTEQENVLRDAGGQVVGGEVGKVEEIIDVWTFARDTKSPGSDWMLVETRS